MLKNSKRTERLLAVVALATIVLAWWIGYSRASASAEPALSRLVPAASRFGKLDDTTFAAYDGKSSSPMAYVSVGQANGYGGPMKVAVAVDLQGHVLGVTVVEHKETPAWYSRVARSTLLKNLLGKSYQDAFVVGQDVDAVSGATYTTSAIAEAVLQASRRVAANQLGLRVPEEAAPPIRFGIPEIVLIALFAAGYIGHRPAFKFKKALRWVTMLVGLIVLGFLYNTQLTITYFSQLLLGYLPTWQSHLYWYLLLGGILFVFTVDNKNPYCEWFCPFGAAQECMGAIGGAHVRSVGRWKNTLVWLQRVLAWLAILIALIFRNPGLSSYEVFGTLFNLTGSTWQFALLGIVLIASLFIRRPWCSYLCPLRPIVDLYRTFRNWVLETWTSLRTQKAA